MFSIKYFRPDNWTSSISSKNIINKIYYEDLIKINDTPILIIKILPEYLSEYYDIKSRLNKIKNDIFIYPIQYETYNEKLNIRPFMRVLNSKLPSLGTPTIICNKINNFINNFNKIDENLLYIIFKNSNINISIPIKNSTEYTRYCIPYKVSKDKIIYSVSNKINIEEILKYNSNQLKELNINKTALIKYNEFYKILLLYLHNTLNLFIDLNLKYLINIDNNINPNNYKENLKLSFIKLRKIINNNLYNICPPLYDSKNNYNIKMDKGVYDINIDVKKNIDILNIFDYSGEMVLFNSNYFVKFLYGLKNKIYDINTNELLDYGSIIYNKSNLGLNKLFKENKTNDFKSISDNINRENDNLLNDINIIKDIIYNGVIEDNKNNIIKYIDDNISNINNINIQYNEYFNESNENLLILVNFSRDIINNNYNRRRKLTEKIASCKLLANYYYLMSELYKNYFLEKCKDTNYKIKFLDNYKKINKDILNKIKSSTKQINKIINNNINVTDYKHIEFWNRLQALIRGRGIYIPIIKNKELHLFNILDSCISGKISREYIVNSTKYFYERFNNNIILIAEDSRLYIDDNNFRFFPESLMDSLYNANDELMRTIIFRILYDKKKYIANSMLFNSDNQFIIRLHKYNKELGINNLYENRKQIMSQMQCSNMIASLI